MQTCSVWFFKCRRRINSLCHWNKLRGKICNLCSLYNWTVFLKHALSREHVLPANPILEEWWYSNPSMHHLRRSWQNLPRSICYFFTIITLNNQPYWSGNQILTKWSRLGWGCPLCCMLDLQYWWLRWNESCLLTRWIRSERPCS